MNAHLVEIFDSVQGEGPQVGQPTLFVRFAECDLRCRWCDTPDSWRRIATCVLHAPDGSEPKIIQNPVGLDVLDRTLEAWSVRPGHWVSLTGGEPLLQPEAVAAWSAHLRGRGLRVHLETHGLAAEALRRVIPHVDFVSMDWKLASDVRRVSDRGAGPVPDFHDEHERFLEILNEPGAERIGACVKLVVTPESTREEIVEVARRMARVRPDTTLVLQPVTPTGGTKRPVDTRVLLDHLAAVVPILPDVRVIPQTHKAYGAL